jgi:glycerol-3-phosphate acyltransferase PlsY
MNPWLLSISIAYLLGSIPFGYLLVRIFRKEDIREKGSGNIGATNVARSGAQRAGLATLLLDLGKAYAAVVMRRAASCAEARMTLPWPRPWRPSWATSFPCGWASAEARARPARWASSSRSPGRRPWESSWSSSVFALTRYVSLASIAGAASFPLFGFHFVAQRTPMVVFGFLFIPLLDHLKHHDNIRRLMNGTESRFGAGSESAPRAPKRERRRHEPDSASWALARGAPRWPSPWRGAADTPLSSGRTQPELAEEMPDRESTPLLCPATPCPGRAGDLGPGGGSQGGGHCALRYSVGAPARRLGQIAPLLTRKQIVVSATKGLEETSLLRMSQVIASVTKNPCGVLSGPSFAAEVAAGIPPRSSAAGTPAVAQAIQQAFSSPTLRIYTNEDVTGVELGGALKNVIALAAGVVHGLDLGNNAALR